MDDATQVKREICSQRCQSAQARVTLEEENLRCIGAENGQYHKVYLVNNLLIKLF